LPPEPSVEGKRGRPAANRYDVEFIGDRKLRDSSRRGVAATVLAGRRERRSDEREGLEIVAGPGGLEVLDAVAVEALLGEFFDVDDLGGDEDGGLALLVGDGDFDEGLRIIVFGALEAHAAFGHVFAGDDFVAAFGMTNAGGISDSDARVLATIDAREGGFFGSRWRHGEDGATRLTLRLVSKLPSGLRAGGVNCARGRSDGLRQGRVVLRGVVRLSVERRWCSGRNGRRCGRSRWRRSGI
jgi:hypothetical protein